MEYRLDRRLIPVVDLAALMVTQVALQQVNRFPLAMAVDQVDQADRTAEPCLRGVVRFKAAPVAAAAEHLLLPTLQLLERRVALALVAVAGVALQAPHAPTGVVGQGDKVVAVVGQAVLLGEMGALAGNRVVVAVAVVLLAITLLPEPDRE